MAAHIIPERNQVPAVCLDRRGLWHRL